MNWKKIFRREAEPGNGPKQPVPILARGARWAMGAGVIFIVVSVTVLASGSSHPLDAVYEKHAGKIAGEADTVSMVRRLSLHIRGVIPTAEESRNFSGSSPANRVNFFAVKFLKEPDYAHYWSQIFGSLLREKTRMRGVKHGSYYDYISQSLHENKPYNKMVRELIMATGSSAENPAANFYLRDGTDPLQVAEYVSRAFYGRRFSCARCHDHPFDKDFTRRHYYGVAAFFSQVWTKRRKQEMLPRKRMEHLRRADQRKEKQKQRDWRRNYWRKLTPRQRREFRKKSRLEHYEVAFDARLGLRFPYSDDAPGGDLVKPRLPDGTEPLLEPEDDRRKVFARWLTGKKNKRFRMVLINRVWTRLMGWSFFTPLDDWGPKTKLKHPEILEHLDQVFLNKKYKVKDLILYIVTSKAYARSAPRPGEDDLKNRARYYQPHRMDAYQLFNSLLRGTRTAEIRGIRERALVIGDVDLTGKGGLKRPANRRELRKKGLKFKGFSNACEVGRPVRRDTFLAVFGAGERNNIDDDEKGISTDQALVLINGRVVRRLVNRYGRKDSRILKEWKEHQDMLKSMETVYGNLLNRPMSNAEKSGLERMARNRLARRKKRFNRRLVQDLVWSIINSHEFIHVR